MTSVVEKTPAKEAEEVDGSCPNSLAGAGSSSESGCSGEESESEENPTATKPHCINLFTSISEKGKRPATASPEATSETEKNDKKKKKNNVRSSTSVRSSSRQGKGTTQK